MRQYRYALIVIFLGTINVCYSYHKFCYTTYNYPNDENRKQTFESMMQKEVPVYQRNKADYLFSYPNGKGYCFVRITKKDKRKIQEILLLYEACCPIDEKFIRHVASCNYKYREIVWILEDFRREYEQVTVGDVVRRLKKS